MLVVALKFLFGKLVGDIPEEQKKKALEQFESLLSTVAEAAAKGAAEGVVEGVKSGKNN